jgi:myo-inositol-1(or 4)-monophosphatase
MGSDTTPADLLSLAVDIATEAGALLLQRPDDLDVDTKSTPTDVVTAMDKASEALIVDRLARERPGDGMLGEEGTDDAGTTGVRWVVDPLDGTVNYLYRLPFWAVSIGIEVDGVTVAGVVHAPVLGWTFTATAGGPARRGSEVLSGSPVTELSQTLLGTGFSYGSELRAKQGKYIGELLPRVRDIRRYGSGALDLCMAATGLIDAYVEQGLHPWDLSAGGLVARRAGLSVTGTGGRSAGHELVVAAPPGIAVELLAALEELGA